MSTHDHTHDHLRGPASRPQDTTRPSALLGRPLKTALLMVALVGGFYLLREHWNHVAGNWVYLLLLAAPLVGAWRSPRDVQRVARLYGASILVAGYVGAGLTDLMFGFEFHTALYVVLAVVLVGYCRDRAETGA